VLAALDRPDWFKDADTADAVRAILMPLAAHYFLKARGPRGRLVDSVARFHLGNGARLEQLNFLGDVSEKGLQQAHGLMVNYLYDLDEIEANHEAFVEKGTVAASSAVKKLLRAKVAAGAG
jgi:malonyl-CoA decarboxylase